MSQAKLDAIRDGFNKAAEAAKIQGNSDAVARIELCREYFTNAAFRRGLEQVTWEIATASK